MVTARRHRVDRTLTQLVLHGVQPRHCFLGREAIIGKQRQRTLQERKRLPAIVTLDDHVLRNTARPAAVARFDECTVADQLLEATFLDAEETADLVGGQDGDINTGHKRKTTPFIRRTDVGTSSDFTKTPIESSK